MKLDIKTSDGKKLQFNVKGHKAILGRSVKCDVVIPEEALSRQHCQIELKNGTFYITDLGSANGVFLDGVRIEPNVETAFASFNGLTLGSLVECQVEDNESTSSFQKLNIPQPASTPPPRREKVEKVPEAERPTKRLNRDAINKPLVMKNEPPKATGKKINPVIILAAVAILGLGFFFLTSEEEPVIDESVVVRKPKRNRMRRNTVAQFKTTAQYSELKLKGNCAAHQFYCDNLKVDAKYLETIYNEGLSYIIYLNPQRWLEHPQYNSIKSAPNNLDLVAFNLVLTSNLVQEYYSKRVSEIELVIVDPMGTPKKVYRLNPAVMNPDVVPKLELEMSLGDAITKGNATDFLDKIKTIIPSTELN